jgi:DNA-directed RNA polymerase specialized sigma24 family protein
MPPSPKLPPSWWDREHDRSGREIRTDVRRAAEQLWPRLFRFAQQVIADSEFEAQELLERVVDSVSRYLSAKNAALQDPSGLLVVKFRQELYRVARKQRRLETVGRSSDVAEPLRCDGWADEADRSIFLQELVRALSERNRGVLRLRMAGYDWREIAQMLQVNVSTLRNSFWRDVRKLYLQFLGSNVDEQLGSE